MHNVFFDQRWCVQNGIGRFATELKTRLENAYSIRLHDIELSHPPTHPLDAIRLSRFLISNRASLFISPGFNVPIWSRCPVVATVHDLIHVQYRGEQSLAKSLYYRMVQRPVIRRSPVTLTVSQFSREQIIDWYGVSPSQVVSIRNGISDAFKPEGPKRNASENDPLGRTAALQDKAQLHAHLPYFVYVGNTKPHKNLPVLLDAMQSLAATTSARLLMVVKSNEWLRSELESRSLTQRIDLVSGVDDEKLATYYRSAVATILPSHFEGFGLPLVEAMACGCPVIGANVTSIPEVMGTAGIQFSPDNPAELADIMRGLLENPSERQHLAEKGLVRAADFSWDHVAGLAHAAISPLLGQTIKSIQSSSKNLNPPKTHRLRAKSTLGYTGHNR